jgi:hypothetical protein
VTLYNHQNYIKAKRKQNESDKILANLLSL